MTATLETPGRIRPPLQPTLWEAMVVDNFAGGGGASLGIELGTGRIVDLAINHDPAAILMHATNHPHTKHLAENVFEVDPVQACNGRPVALAWFSPDCTHFSRAKGSKPLKKTIRGLAWVVLKWAALKRPALIILENVAEFRTWGPLNRRRRPIKAKRGATYERWREQLTALGYVVEDRVLNAADYGAPTHRRRLFVVARCDGQAIRWPEPTHGPGRANAYRTAAECIDWSIPCPSIFDRRRPLAEKTMRRIAMGIRRYVLESPKPFIVQVNHGGDEFRGQEVNEPLGTVTAKHGYGVVMPTLVECANATRNAGTRAADQPLPTVTAQPKGGSWALAAATLTQWYGEAPHQETRGQSCDEPLRTIPATPKHAIVTAFLAKHFGGVVGQELTQPASTITAKDHHGLVAAHLTKFYGTATGADPADPLHTVTGAGQKHAMVAAFLAKYYGCGVGQGVDEPIHTVVSKDRYALVIVTIDGEPYVLADIGLRMLTPRELARCQGFPDEYVLTGSKSQQVARIGNSVAPPVAAAVARANYMAGGKQEAAA